MEAILDIQNLYITRAKDVLPKIDSMQAAEITPRQRRNGPVCWCVPLFAASIPSLLGRWECTACFLSLVTLTFDLHIQTHPS